MKEVYPLKFHPILKEKVWGGEKLNSLLCKKTTSKTTGESWEISDVEGNFSVVKSGEFAGKTLRELIQTHKEKLVGKKVYEQFGNRFPLLIKFIDAKENLSVQLHPDDFLAKKRHDSFGKTEMWYVVQADDGAEIIVGFNENTSKETYLKHLREKSLPKILNAEQTQKGDVFFIKPGLVHAIGGGVLLAEIQQTSDVTYRVYDWNRKGLDGKPRELHTDLAIDAIDFTTKANPKIPYSLESNETCLVENNYFKTKLLSFSGKMEMNYQNKDSFVVYICVEGEAIVKTKGTTNIIKMGETLLLPAICNKVLLKAEMAKLLEVSV
ncbi:MAG TPA: type I phosphomannose isomerase catalytic subunit [Flavobacteriaceae bacterium]|nr:type I phosphomannose isomerase catalytic subunit [Flavobacteriaceae bacterium]